MLITFQITRKARLGLTHLKALKRKQDSGLVSGIFLPNASLLSVISLLSLHQWLFLTVPYHFPGLPVDCPSIQNPDQEV
jgi:hypothetical protein